jgi:hypothetical protein
MNKGRCINEGQVWFGFIFVAASESSPWTCPYLPGCHKCFSSRPCGQRVPVALSRVLFFLFLTTCFIFLVTGVLLILSTSFDLLYDRPPIALKF